MKSILTATVLFSLAILGALAAQAGGVVEFSSMQKIMLTLAGFASVLTAFVVAMINHMQAPYESIGDVNDLTSIQRTLAVC